MVPQQVQKRVVHVVYSFASIGGLENGIINIINHLDQQKYFHIVCSLTDIGKIKKRVYTKNVKYFSLGKVEGNDITIPYKLFKIFKKEKPDVVHLRNWATMVEGYVAARISNIPHLIYSEHGRHFEDLWENKKIQTAVHRYILNHVDTTLCVSLAVAQEMSRLYDMRKVVKVIINGVDTEKFKPLYEKENIRNKFGIPSDQQVIGTVGRLDNGKNFDQLIVDFLSYCRSGLLVIAGEGAEYDKLKILVDYYKAQDRIRLIGHIDNIPSIMNSFDIFVLPSASEGLSNVILEAMSCGLPVVAYDVGGNRELIKSEKGGFLVDPCKREALMQAISRVLVNRNQIKDMAEFNRNRIISQFSIKRMIKAYSVLYDSE